MSNSVWQINRVGLINFWYYDEEEFHFIDGRMLLRGANGSGKSVTMQSFIPLLLDGNMRPERLDPFGSRARKMENYLLEEDDDREERTGYLYMELKRTGADQYVTIGIGMRGRRNKKLDSWYFYIKDGRRIGYDINLYKDVQSKIPYTKTELRNRIEDGGAVMESQAEYMESVNRLLFGFETIEEYKEMLELLIQLRTPKLSKDFKPSIINDILSNSLRTLSEEDLRPMSEAIENMDSIKINLSTLNESISASESIYKTFNEYNQRMLYDKAAGLIDLEKEYNKCAGDNEKLNKDLEKNNSELENYRQQYEKLERESTILEREKESLAKNDAFNLKKDEERITKEIGDYEKQLKEKSEQEERKKSDWNTENKRRKEQEEQNECVWSDIENNLNDMDSLMEDIPFDDSHFFVQELRDRERENISFEAHTKEFKSYKEKIESGVKILKEEKQENEKYESVLAELDELKKNRDNAESDYKEYEKLLFDTKEEHLEKLYIWRKNNKVMAVSDEIMQDAANKISRYYFQSDYSEIKDLLWNEKNGIKDVLETKKRDIRQMLNPKKKDLEELNEEINQWMEKKEPEPERTIQVEKNREKLKELGIPYYNFYKVIDFSEKLDEKQRNQIEEALYNMGILDALIVSESDRERILATDEGLCDKYIFSDVSYVQNNLTEYMDVYNEENNIIFYQQVSKILSSIGLFNGKSDNSNVWIDEKGNYKLGIIEGTVTKQYQSKFIGTLSRERYKKEMIEKLQNEQTLLKAEIDELEADINSIDKELECLEIEWKELPKEDDLKLAAKELDDKDNILKAVRRDIERKEKTLEERQKILDDLRLKVQAICSRAYISIRLDVFEDAAEKLKEYGEYLYEVKSNYTTYKSGIQLLAKYRESLESIDEDLDNIRYDIGKLNNTLGILGGELESIRQQLSLSDYKDIEEKLDKCVKRLDSIPKEKETCIREQSRRETNKESLKNALERNAGILERAAEAVKEMRAVFAAEYRLGYVEDSVPEDSKMLVEAERIKRQLEGQLGGDADTLHGKVQEVFHERKGALTEYGIAIQNLFEDLAQSSTLISRKITRIDIKAKYRGTSVNFQELLEKLKADRDALEKILDDKDRELFEDILANTISKKIRARINASKRWVERMNSLMESMQTSSGLKLNLRWKSKKAEKEGQLDTNALVELLQKDVEIMREEEVEKMSVHFRSKIAEARKQASEIDNTESFHMLMKEILDYRKWFEFQLEFQKSGERKKELTDREFFKFSGGEKAMSMYVPLFSAVVAKYNAAREDAPRLISLDEAFAGVDEMNIKDMFRLMVEFRFNFMINSQVLWGDYETVPGIAIYQLVRPENAKYVSVIPYVWNGKSREMVKRIGDEIER